MTNSAISHIESFRNFAPKSELMRRLCFSSTETFLNELDGKVYAICEKNGRYLCDIVEDDYLRLMDARILVDLDESRDYTLMEADSSVLITLDLSEKGYNDFKERYGILIDIGGECHTSNFKDYSIDYEIDNLILKSSTDESETAFVFMDGIAIQIESLDSCIPVSHPIILTYPRKNEVCNNVRMRREIERFRGHSWEGDNYSIALLYGKERKLKYVSHNKC